MRFTSSRSPLWLIAILCIPLLSSAAYAGKKVRLAISSPLAETEISGTYTFQVSLSKAISSSTAIVEFYLGSRQIGVATEAPFAFTWNTAWAADGDYELEADALGTNGKVLATSTTDFRINNLGDTLTLNSPTGNSPWKGTVTLTLNGSDSLYYPAIWQVLIDGSVVGYIFTDNEGTQQDTVTLPIDTTAFSNGAHELYVGMHSDFWIGSDSADKFYYNNRGGLDEVVEFSNGHQFMEVVPTYQSLYLQPGGAGTIGCRRHFTDGSYGSCVSPSYKSSNPTIVGVTAAGVVTAGATEGFATIVVSDGNKSASTFVWVRDNSAVVHFAGNGQILNAYSPSASLFVIAPFDLEAEEMIGNPGLTQTIQSSGVNSISEGFYLNPRNTNATYQDWLSYYDQYIAPDWQFAALNGFHIIATGDEVCRNPGDEGWYTLNWPEGQQAVQYAVQQLAESGVAISIEMVDEADTFWGSTPNPPGQVGANGGPTQISCSGTSCTVDWPDNPIANGTNFGGDNFALSDSQSSTLNTPSGQVYTASGVSADQFSFIPAAPTTGTFTSATDPSLEYQWWAGNLSGCPSQPCDPPVPNDALTTIYGWMHQVAPTVPISWPLSAESPASVFGNWMSKGSVSDYSSHYWTSYNLRPAYAWTTGVEEANSWLTEEFYSRQPFLAPDDPQLMEVSISGPYYEKESASDPYYDPGQDVLIQPGTTGPVVVSQMMTEAALGVAGERLYFFEQPGDEESRAEAPAGTVFQTGSNPTATDPLIQENWEALRYGATALTQVLTPFLLQTQISSPSFGSNIITSARTGSAGTILLIVNDNDWSREITVNLRSYGKPSNAYRYVVGAHGAEMTSPTSNPTDVITLTPGQAAAYLFPSAEQLQKLKVLVKASKQQDQAVVLSRR